MSFVAVDAALFPRGLPGDFPVSVETIESKKIVGIEVLSAVKAQDRNEFRTPCIAAFVTSPAVAINPLVPVFVAKVAVTDEEVASLTGFIVSYAECTVEERTDAAKQWAYKTLVLDNFQPGACLHVHSDDV